jgi:U3 small nucleolar RNA-associated protein 11
MSISAATISTSPPPFAPLSQFASNRFEMSSLRNAVKRVTHKERSQPQHRAHLGILEKKKDYKVRATDYHRKEDRINAARQKAAFRNPDEFYFGMHNAQVSDGKHRKTVEAQQKEFEDQVGTDTVRIMKDQDLSYVRMQKQRDAKKIDRLQSSLHYIEGASENSNKKRKHTVFVDSNDDAANFDVAKHFDTLPELAGRAFNRPRVETLKKAAMEHAGFGTDDDAHKPTASELALAAKQAKKVAKKAAKARSAAYAEVEARAKRVAAMERAEAHLVTEKLVASKGRKRKITPAENGKPAVYKWRRKRLS